MQKLIKILQDIPGIISVSPEHCPELGANQIFCVIEFDPDQLRLSPDEVALRNYNSTLRRGLINDETTVYDFNRKLIEELDELIESSVNFQFDPSELADISLVCDAMAMHYAIDLPKEKEAKMLINEQR